MRDPIPNYWDTLHDRFEEALRLPGGLFASIGTADLNAAYWAAVELSWAFEDHLTRIVKNFRDGGRLGLEVSEKEVLEELIAFGFGMEGPLDDGTLPQLAGMLPELASSRTRPCRVGPQIAASAADAVTALGRDLLDLLREQYSLGWFLAAVRNAVPAGLELNPDAFSVVLHEAIRARHLDNKGKLFDGLEKAWADYYGRRIPPESMDKWAACFESIRSIPDLLDRYDRVDYLELVARMRFALRGFDVSRAIAELDLEFCRAARSRLREGIPLAGAADKDEDDGDRLTNESKAIGFLREHPDWSDTRIAEAVGVHRTTLYTWPAYMQAKAAVKSARRRLPRGWKNKRGDVEAWDSDD